MRIVLVTDRWDEAGGGRERYAAELVAALGRVGCRFDVFCREAAQAAPRPGCTLRVFKGPLAEFRMRRATAAARCTRAARPVLALRPLPEATHCQLHSGLYRLAFAAERESFDSDLRRRLHPLGMVLNRRRRYLLALERRTLAGASGTRLMAFSNAVARDVTRTCAVHPDRLTIAPIGIDLDRFRPNGPTSGNRHAGKATAGLRVIFAGHNFVLKGLPQVVAAMGRLRKAGLGVELAVAGRGNTALMRREITRAGVDGSVRFLGPVPQDELAERYRSSDALVHPSFYDPFPRSVLEAMACGCPVVTTARCGTAELMTNGVQGWLIDDPRDVDGLAAALASLADPDRRTQMSEEAAAMAREHRFSDHAARVMEWLSRC